MKKLLLLVFVILILHMGVSYASYVDVQLNGELVDFTDENGNAVKPQIVNNRTMVPMRKIFEKLGAIIEWNNEERIVTAQKGNTTIKLQIDNKVAEKIVNGVVEKITLDTEPIIINDRTMVPLRFIAESLGKQVGWNQVSYTAIIIDYNYFLNLIKNNARALYEHLNNNYIEGKVNNIEIKRNYYDLLNSNNNTTSNINVSINELRNNINSNITQNIDIKFSGNSELINEIINEKWNDISFNIEYLKDKFSFNTNNNILYKMMSYNGEKNKNVSYSEINLNGNAFDTFEKLIQGICRN